MCSTTLKRSLATLAVGVGLLAAAGPASAGTTDDKILIGKDSTHTITMLDYQGTTLKADSNEVAVEGVTAKPR